MSRLIGKPSLEKYHLHRYKTQESHYQMSYATQDEW